jgi:hypothetical protein
MRRSGDEGPARLRMGFSCGRVSAGMFLLLRGAHAKCAILCLAVEVLRACSMPDSFAKMSYTLSNAMLLHNTRASVRL